MALPKLPNELLLIIAEYLDTKSLNALLQTNHAFADLLTPLLHNIALQGYYGIPALVSAAIEGSCSLVRLLLKKGVDINVWSDHPSFMEPLRQAVSFQHKEVVEILLDNGADVTVYHERFGSLLHTAFESEEITRLLLRHQQVLIHINSLSPGRRETALQRAVSYGPLAAAKLLLDHGADPSIPGGQGLTACQVAIINGNGPGVKLLLDNGVPINGKWGHDGKTLLHYAVEYRQVGIVKLLLEEGADDTIENDLGVTALDRAVHFGYRDEAHELIAAIKAVSIEEAVS